MGVTDWKREWAIYKTLKALSKQRVAIILQPGNVWVIEKAIQETDKTAANLRTCQLRGWVEPLENAIPQGTLTPDGKLPDGDIFTQVRHLYRLTDSGWAAINRTHILLLFSIFLALITLIISVYPWP